jgi:hypothetical protein
VLLMLEDPNDGIIAISGGTARGYGSVRVDFTSADWLPDVAEGAACWRWWRAVLVALAEGR